MAKKKASKKKAAATNKAPTKGQMYGTISEKTELTRKEVASVFDELNVILKKSLKQNQQVTVPGICKLVVKKKPATKARKGTNPFTGEEMMFKAKPASKTVRARPLKAVKDMV